MNNLPRKEHYNNRWCDIAIFSAVWFYLWFIVDIKLIYHGAGRIFDFPSFFKTSQFFHSYLLHPAGLLEYFNAFASQMFYYSWLGAIVITAVVWLSSVFIRYILARMELGRLSILRLLPAFIAVITFSQYTYRFQFLIAAMVMLAFTSLYCGFKIRNSILDIAAFLFLSVLLYVIAGPISLVFAVLVLLYRFIRVSNLAVTIIFSFSAALVPYLIGSLCFKDSITNVYTQLMPFSWKVIAVEPVRITLIWVYVLYFTLPAIILGCLIKKKFFSFGKSDPVVKEQKLSKFTALKVKIELLFEHHSILRPVLFFVFWLGLLTSVYFLAFDTSKKVAFEVDYNLTSRNWEKVVFVARQSSARSYYVSNSVNQALYHQGLLGEEMFEFPQHPFGLFLSDKSYTSVHWPRISLLMNLGFVNYAEHEIVESLEKFGPRPYLLKNMILSMLAKRNYATAKVYLNQLCKTFFEHKWADDYIQRLEADPDMEDDLRIQYLRKNMVSKNYGFSSYPIDDVLIALLEKNSENKMAFEYLVTWYLLNGKIGKVVNSFGVINSLGYKKLPKYYQQAYLIYTSVMGRKGSLQGYKLEPDILKTTKEAIGYFNMLRAGDANAIKILSEKYNDSYVFYFISLPSIMQK